MSPQPATSPQVQVPAPLAGFLSKAQAVGLLPADAETPVSEQRPWPVVLLTALGAWLSALPLLGVVGMLLGDLVLRSAGTYLVGALLLAGAMVVLRARDVPIFVEQLAIPLLLTGAGALGFGLFRDLPAQLAAMVLCLLSLACGVVVNRAWLRTLFGAAAAPLFTAALLPDTRWLEQDGQHSLTLWLALHGTFAGWVAAMAVQRRELGTPRGAMAALCIEHMGAGWLLVCIAGLAWLSGTTFLLGGAMGSGVAREIAGAVTQDITRFTPAGSVLAAGSMLLGLAACACAARVWPSPRQPACAGVALVLVVLCGFLSMLGAVLLACAITAVTRRWRLASACAVAAAWIIGGFYYLLAWPLATKAAVLVAAAVVLGALAWWARTRSLAQGAPVHIRDAGTPPTLARIPAQDYQDTQGPGPRDHLPMPGAPKRRVTALLATTGAAILLVANVGIWQKEDLITHGQPLFVPLAPVDPRSLMQGDYMRLRFALPAKLEGDLDSLVTLQRPHVVATRDARGVGSLLRIHTPAEPLANGEFTIELTPKDGNWVLVSDAWFFREGEAERFAQAKFGEFRVAPDGRALLVGMADGELRAIAP